MRRRDFLALSCGLGMIARGDTRAAGAIELPDRLIWPAAGVIGAILHPISGRSHYGGRPRLPRDFVWPSYGGRPLDFLLQVDLAELAGFETGLDLPKSGRLLFFYDMKTQPWGFDPVHAGSARVFHIEGDAAGQSDEPWPMSPVPMTPIQFRQIRTVPNPWSLWIDDLRPSAVERSDLDDLLTWRYHSGAQIGGHPDVLQGAGMEVESELASSGHYRGGTDPVPYPDAVMTRLAKQWRLLLQLPSDDALGTMWGDNGMIYFWIREADLAKRDFSRVWLILQCF
jgi:uncharacterized protein YwqG